MSSLGMEPKKGELKAMMKAIDKNNDGRIGMIAVESVLAAAIEQASTRLLLIGTAPWHIR